MSRLQPGDWPATTRIAAAFAALSAMTVVLTVVRAVQLRTDDVSAPATTAAPALIAQRSAGNAIQLRSAAAKSPFDSPAGAAVSTPAVAASVVQAPIPMRPKLVGTVVDARGGFVMMELLDGRVQLVRIGERVGELRLRTVAANQAIFDDANGNRVVLRTQNADPENLR